MKNKTDRYNGLNRLHKISYKDLLDSDDEGGSGCDSYDRLCNNREWLSRVRQESRKLQEFRSSISRAMLEITTFFDPTGISGWGSLDSAYQEFKKDPTKHNLILLAHTIVDVVPGINKAAKGIGAVSSVTQAMYASATRVIETEEKEAS